jgi:hypothetical protein
MRRITLVHQETEGNLPFIGFIAENATRRKVTSFSDFHQIAQVHHGDPIYQLSNSCEIIGN